VIDTDAYFPNDQTSNGEAKGTEDEGKIKRMKARSHKRAANRGGRLARVALIETIESNHEAFVNDGTVMSSAGVDELLATEHISAPNSGQPESEEATGGLQSNFTNSNVTSSQLKLSQ
jgi:hypothetical protein